MREECGGGHGGPHGGRQGGRQGGRHGCACEFIFRQTCERRVSRLYKDEPRLGGAHLIIHNHDDGNETLCDGGNDNNNNNHDVYDEYVELT